MSTDTATTHAPDLSALTPTERLNLEVALTQGARWMGFSLDDPEPCNVLRAVGGAPIASDGNGLARFPVRYWGPNYAGDSSAWGSLMEKERVWPTPYTDALTGEETWCGNYPLPREEGHDMFVWSDRVLSVGEAVAAATLLKHGVDPTPYIGDWTRAEG